MLMMHATMKDTIDEKTEKKLGYEMIPRKTKLSIELNRPVAEEEHEFKNGSIVKVEIKPKIEGDMDMNDSNQQCNP